MIPLNDLINAYEARFQEEVIQMVPRNRFNWAFALKPKTYVAVTLALFTLLFIPITFELFTLFPEMMTTGWTAALIVFPVLFFTGWLSRTVGYWAVSTTMHRSLQSVLVYFMFVDREFDTTFGDLLDRTSREEMRKFYTDKEFRHKIFTQLANQEHEDVNELAEAALQHALLPPEEDPRT